MDPAILLIIVFIVAPLIERLLKAGKQGGQLPPPQGGRPPQQGRLPQQPGSPPRQQESPPQRPGRMQQHGETSQQRAEPAWEDVGSEEVDDDIWQQVSGPHDPTGRRKDEEAAAMLPDDLWEILTGERRSPLPVPQRAPEPAEEYGSDVAGAAEPPSAEEWTPAPPEDAPIVVQEAAAYVRPVPRRDVPRVTSLEELEFDDDLRHEQFHDRLDTLGGPARVRRRAPSAYQFTSDADLRRAIIMAEILGTPKGLQ